jgi:hypothetical protein
MGLHPQHRIVAAQTCPSGLTIYASSRHLDRLLKAYWHGPRIAILIQTVSSPTIVEAPSRPPRDVRGYIARNGRPSSSSATWLVLYRPGYASQVNQSPGRVPRQLYEATAKAMICTCECHPFRVIHHYALDCAMVPSYGNACVLLSKGRLQPPTLSWGKMHHVRPMSWGSCKRVLTVHSSTSGLFPMAVTSNSVILLSSARFCMAVWSPSALVWVPSEHKRTAFRLCSLERRWSRRISMDGTLMFSCGVRLAQPSRYTARQWDSAPLLKMFRSQYQAAYQ